jgi:drug/metabolite transporter (DMT)-like permease
MVAIIAGLAAALAWAVSTVSSSRSTRQLGPEPVIGWIALVGLLITLPFVIADGVPSGFHGEGIVWFALSGAGNIIGLQLTYRAFRTGAVSLVAPIVATEGALAAVISVAFGEHISLATGCALAVVALGTVFASSSRGAADVPGSKRAAGLALTAALSFGVSLYATGRAGDVLPTAWVLLSARAIGTVTIAGPLIARGRLILTRRAAPLVMASAVAEVAGFALYTKAARHDVAVASVLACQFAAMSAIAGYLLFGERLSRIQLLGVLTVIVGVTAVSGLNA